MPDERYDDNRLGDSADPGADGGADRGGDPGGPQWWRPERLLAPGPCAVVAIVLAVLTLMGNNLMVAGVQAMAGDPFVASSDLAGYFITVGLALLLPALVTVWLARRALTMGVATAVETVLARAAFVLGVVAVVYAALALVGGLLHHDTSGPPF